MKSFFKYTFATVLGLFLFFFVGMIILIGIGAASGNETVEVKDNSVLKIDLSQPIAEREQNNPLEELGIPGAGANITGLYELKKAIAKAKADEKIKGILLEGSFGRIGYATNEEIRAALLDFKKSGKFIYSYGEYFSESNFYTATVSDSIFLNPEGLVEFNGISSEIMFFKGALDKLEIQPEVFRVGEFKSAVEPFLRENMSDANRLQATSFLNSINQHVMSQVAVNRKLTPESVKLSSDSMKARSAEDAVRLGLVSKAAYYDQVLSTLKKKLGVEKDEDVNFISYNKYRKAEGGEEASGSENKIAIIIGQGEINSGKGDNESIGSDKICEALRKARNDSKIKAVVLRINSPGGSALASDVMWREIQLTKKVKPVIASMSDVAASGGYYMAMGCDKIVAHPTTITGSIGVFGLMFNAQNMFKNKLGITFDGVKTGAYSDIGNGTRPFTPGEKQIIQSEVDKIYETFTTKAAAGRKMPVETLKSLAGGRVWSGTEAKANGLVDELGGLDKAIEMAAAQAKIGKDYRIKLLPAQKNFIEEIMEQIGGEARVSMAKAELGELYPLVKQFQKIKTMEGINARLPYDFILN
ncbi:MAG TPA: signal peptide peptidase SppA [Catalimonadaceae bacterium]|nr:signal peptide peptidase SppA [Catalimonadaceae bacterium]